MINTHIKDIDANDRILNNMTLQAEHVIAKAIAKIIGLFNGDDQILRFHRKWVKLMLIENWINYLSILSKRFQLW